MGRNVYQERARQLINKYGIEEIIKWQGGRGSRFSKMKSGTRRYLSQEINNYIKSKGDSSRVEVDPRYGVIKKRGRYFGLREDGKVGYVKDPAQLLTTKQLASGAKPQTQAYLEQQSKGEAIEVKRAVQTAKKTGQDQILRIRGQAYTIKPSGAFQVRGRTVGEQIQYRYRTGQDIKAKDISRGGRVLTTYANYAGAKQASTLEKRLKTSTPEQQQKLLIKEASKSKLTLLRDSQNKKAMDTLISKAPNAPFKNNVEKTNYILNNIQRNFTRSEQVGILRAQNKKTGIYKIADSLFIKVDKDRYSRSAVTQAKRTGLAFLGQLVISAYSLTQLPKAIANIAKNPKLLLNLPSEVKKGINNYIYLIRTDSAKAVGVIGADLVVLKGSSKALDFIGKTSTAIRIRLDPRVIKKTNKGQTIILPNRKGGFNKLRITESLPKENIRKQIKLAGKKVDAISSQADALLTILSGRKLIKKPVGDTSKLSKKGATLLEKFDKGKLSAEQVVLLDRELKKAGIKGILERSFFADPRGRIRPSRLGLKGKTPKANVLDFLLGNVKFKSNKPQILFFRDVKISSYPKRLQPVVQKIKRGKKLNYNEYKSLLNWQIKTSGQFKPLGFISRESEITLAPGEIIKKRKTLGKIEVNGKLVPITEVEILKLSGDLKKLVLDFRKGKLGKKQASKLDSLLKRETGLDYKIRSYYTKGKKYVNPYKGLARLGYVVYSSKKLYRGSKVSKIVASSIVSSLTRSKLSKKSKVSNVTRTSKTSKASKVIKRSKVSKTSKTSRVSKTSKTSKPSSPTRSIKINIPSKPKYIPKTKTISFKTKTPRGYTYAAKYAYRRKGKRVISRTNYTLNRALREAIKRVDKSTARSFEVRAVGLTKTKDIKAPASLKKFRMRRGKDPRVLIFVEKAKYAIDSPQEKRQLRSAKRKSKRKKR